MLSVGKLSIGEAVRQTPTTKQKAKEMFFLKKTLRERVDVSHRSHANAKRGERERETFYCAFDNGKKSMKPKEKRRGERSFQARITLRGRKHIDRRGRNVASRVFDQVESPTR